MIYKLRSLLIPQNKSKIKAGEGKQQGEYRFFTSSLNQTKYYDLAEYDKPALIFGTGGSASVHYCNEPFSTSTDCLVMYGIQDTNLELIYQYLLTNIHILQAGFKGAGLQHISKEYILDIEIDLPSLEEQSNITCQMRLVDSLITDNHKQLSHIDQLVKSRFIELFGNVIINDKSWPEYIFSEIADSRLGKMLDAKQQTGEHSYPYLANFNVQWFRFNMDNLNKMDFNEADRIEFALEDGDLLVCEGGEIGRCAVWHNELSNCYFQKALHRVRCKKEKVNPIYLAYWFKYNCDHGGFAAIEGAKATIAHLPGAKLKQLTVSVPPIERQNEFATFVEQTDKLKSEVKQSLEKLETLKKALMQKYFG